MSWLVWLGKRRPTDLSDQASYAEQVSRPKADPVSHKNPFGVEGHQLGGRSRGARGSKSSRFFDGARGRRGKS